MALSMESLSLFVPFDCSMASFETYDLSIVVTGSRATDYRAVSINKSPDFKRSLPTHQDLSMNS